MLLIRSEPCESRRVWSSNWRPAGREADYIRLFVSDFLHERLFRDRTRYPESNGSIECREFSKLIGVGRLLNKDFNAGRSVCVGLGLTPISLGALGKLLQHHP